MSCANEIQESLVNMDIMSQAFSTCVDEYKLAYFRKAKEKILRKLDNPPACVQSKAQLQLDNSLVPDQLLAASQSADTENRLSWATPYPRKAMKKMKRSMRRTLREMKIFMGHLMRLI
jgi:hypothetical protein